MMRRLALPVTVAAACLGASACGVGGGRGFEVGVKSEGVNLAFANGPLKTTQVVRLMPEPVPSYGAFLAQAAVLESPPLPQAGALRQRLASHSACPAAPAGARPAEAVKVLVTSPPRTGAYTTHNKGRFSLTQGTVKVSGNYPPEGLFMIGNVRTQSSSSTAQGNTSAIFYDVVVTGVDGSQTTTTYRSTVVTNSPPNRVNQTAGTGPGTTGELDLVKQVVVNSNGTSTFQPNPPVTMVSFVKGPGTSWNSTGVDQQTGTTMVVQGSISSEEVVDVCGQVYDAYRVVSNERITNAGLSSSTNPQDPNVYDIAPQYGGLILRQHIDTQTNYTEKGAPVGLSLNYVATLDSITPS